MPRVFIALSSPVEKSVFRQMILNLNLYLVGESSSWPDTIANVVQTKPKLLIIEWEMFPKNMEMKALTELVTKSTDMIVVLIFNDFDFAQKNNLSSMVDVFIDRKYTAGQAEHLLKIAVDDAGLL